MYGKATFSGSNQISICLPKVTSDEDKDFEPTEQLSFMTCTFTQRKSFDSQKVLNITKYDCVSSIFFFQMDKKQT